MLRIYILTIAVLINSYAVWDNSKMEKYKKKYSNNNKNSIETLTSTIASKSTEDEFKKKYGKKAYKRLKHFNKTIKKLKTETLVNKLKIVDKLVNLLHFKEDKNHWKQKNYWASPLEVIGTSCGDTEDMSLLKYLMLVKVGIDPKDIQFISKNKSFKHGKKSYKENISLFYFPKNNTKPIVMDYHYKGGKLYRYKEQFTYKTIKKTPNKELKNIFSKNVTSNDFETLGNLLTFDSSLKTNHGKSNINIFY